MAHSTTLPSERRTRRLRGAVGAVLLAGLMMFGSAAGAQTTDDPEAGGTSDQGSSDTGSSVATPAPAADTGSGSSGGGNLALTGGDVTGLLVIGAAAAGAGAVLVVGSRRRQVAEAV